jgi:hypothetical protein
MNRIYYPFAVATIALTVFSSCEESSDNIGSNPDFPTVSAGAYILNQGSYFDNIEGSLNVLDYESDILAEHVFKTVNQRSIGATPQCGVAYGSKVYVGTWQSKTIEILDKHTYKSIKQIKLEDSDKGKSPRGMVAKGGYVFVTMDEGFLARLDTASMVIDAAVKVGMNPEVPAIMGDVIYVPNCSHSAGYGTTGTAVSIHPFEELKEFNVPINPQKFLSNGKELFVISAAVYGSDFTPTNNGVLAKINAYTEYEVIGDATMGDIRGNIIYLVNAPWGAPVSYWKYDLVTKTKTEMKFPEVEAPSGIGVDPFRDVLLISSFPMENGSASYTLPGYVCEYTLEGKFIKKYNIGAGPACIFFNME